MIDKVKKLYATCGQYVTSMSFAPSQAQYRSLLLLLGVGLLTFGLADLAQAQQGINQGGSQINFQDDRIIEVIRAMLAYIEGAFGALIMVAAGLGAIVSAAFGQYSAALGLFVVAVGAFILRTLVNTFFSATVQI